MFRKAIHRMLVGLLHVERRFDPFFRPVADALFKEPAAAVIQCLINLKRRPEGLAIAEERALPGEDQALEAIIRTMAEYMHTHWQPGNVQRAGNSKTHGIVRGEVTILDGLPERLRRGLFAEPRTYRAWIRFAGPGPDWPPDIDDVGVLSCAIKLMGVAGAKLMEDERSTQDLLGISIPTFTTPNVLANAKLQSWILKELPLYYFLDPTDSHVLDALMQGLWSKTQSNPLGERYWSCVPYLLGEGQAMKYSIVPRSMVERRIPRLPFRPPENYLRDNMVRTLAERDVAFDVMVQLQTDPFRMPVEDASVRWPEKLSPFVPVARVVIRRQRFDAQAQLDFAKNLSFNPWHCLAEHRPLGNQNRARRKLYAALAALRQRANTAPHIEPNGDEMF